MNRSVLTVYELLVVLVVIAFLAVLVAAKTAKTHPSPGEEWVMVTGLDQVWLLKSAPKIESVGSVACYTWIEPGGSGKSFQPIANSVLIVVPIGEGQARGQQVIEERRTKRDNEPLQVERE